MKLSFECTCCGKDVPFEAPDKSGRLKEINVICQNCESSYTVEAYYDETGEYMGCHAFDYGWYLEHGDKELTICL